MMSRSQPEPPCTPAATTDLLERGELYAAALAGNSSSARGLTRYVIDNLLKVVNGHKPRWRRYRKRAFDPAQMYTAKLI
jgi:hypothetical protein